MITEVKQYMCPFDTTPKDEDIKDCIELAKQNNCIIHLTWRMKWSGDYGRYIYPHNTFEEIKESLPKIYGM